MQDNAPLPHLLCRPGRAKAIPIYMGHVCALVFQKTMALQSDRDITLLIN